MKTSTTWELTIVDAAPPADELTSIAAADIDNDGRIEIVTAGRGAILWYRPDTGERSVIGQVNAAVGIALEDVDGDGMLEIVLGDTDPAEHLYWFKATGPIDRPWERHLIDSATAGHAHDVVFADLDGDGRRELVVNAVYSATPGIYAYKAGNDVKAPWTKICIHSGVVGEGLAIADVDSDGIPEIVNGPDWFHCPQGGPTTAGWDRKTYAPSHREMCRVAIADIAGSGRPDILIVDSEYLDGRLSWFENRLGAPEGPDWIEHVLETGLVYAHSLDVLRTQGEIRVLCAEMGQGGWSAPRNWNARVIEYRSTDNGANWSRQQASAGEGAHGAFYCDIDRDGSMEIVSKDGYENNLGRYQNPKVQIWKQRQHPSSILDFKHRFLDRDKPSTGIELVLCDVDGDGDQEIVCGEWWYRATDGRRYAIPGIHQVVAACDIDGDGKQELIATTARPGANGFYNQLASRLVWLKAVAPTEGRWEAHEIGEGCGDWPHGVLVAPVLPGGRLAMITGYHNAVDDHVRPEIWTVPEDPASGPWPKATLADICYGEEFIACDVDRDGVLDIVAGAHWLQNCGDGTFIPRRIAHGIMPARIAVADVNGNGRPDVVVGQEIMDFEHRIIPKSQLLWYECPEDPRTQEWTPHVIDTVRCAHSVAAADIDGDGEAEIVCGEHDPFWPYRSQCRLYVYKKADPAGKTWTRFTLDDRFEHHDGTKILARPDGSKAIVSHGWADSIYLHIWEPR